MSLDGPFDLETELNFPFNDRELATVEGPCLRLREANTAPAASSPSLAVITANTQLLYEHGHMLVLLWEMA